MTVKYFAILTKQGAAMLANAAALGVKMNLSQMAIGDANGELYTPESEQTSLKNQLRIAPINMLSIDPKNASQIIAEQIIPESEGGYWIREIGLYDDDGILIAIANCPETYKPKLQEGSGRTQTIRMILIVSSTAAITLKIDPSVVLATRQYVDDKIIEVNSHSDELMRAHTRAENPHQQYLQTDNALIEVAGNGLATQAMRNLGYPSKFSVINYAGGVPDSMVTRKSDGTLKIKRGTNNTAAIKSAILDAQKCNGTVYLPAPQNGNAYYFDDTLLPVIDDWRGASIEGDGKLATKLIFGGGDIPAIHVKGTSGWPTNIHLSGISLYSESDFTGEAWKLQGLTGVRLEDFAAYRFADGLTFSNGDREGIFTEFAVIKDGWLENNARNIKFRRDGGDTSFHGVSLEHVISNNLSGQTGLDIGVGCNIYNSRWEQVTFFGKEGVTAINNEGGRNGSDSLFFEGNGLRVYNNGAWNTKGQWRVQNDTGNLIDNSPVQFSVENYFSPTTPVDPNFAATGITSIVAPDNNVPGQMFRNIIRLRGPNVEAVGVVGYSDGVFENQGLAIVSQSANAKPDKISLRHLMHLNGIKTYQSNFALSYGNSGIAQLSINSTGRASGIQGRSTEGAISSNASAQTIKTANFYFPESKHPAHVSIVFSTQDNSVIHSALYVGASSPVGNTTLTLIATLIDIDLNNNFAPPGSVIIDTSGNMSFTVSTQNPQNIRYRITIVGVGAY